MKKYIVTTTINSPTIATKRFCEIADKKGWTFIVIGDTKTPHNEYQKLVETHKNVAYMHPEEQEMYPELSKIIGWKTIQRRNIGLVWAYDQGADIIATVDDDNIPYDNWGDDCYVGQEIEVDCYVNQSVRVFDPFSPTNQKHLWHRGYPIDLLGKKNDIEYRGKVKRKVLIQADFWDGDPDIDAMARLIQKPIVKFDHNEPFCSVHVSPFNSQNTFLHRSVIPYYAVLPFVGRMDDIWGGYLTQRYFRDSIIYNRASVFQDRNVQDLVTNLENETIGYRYTERFIGEVVNQTMLTSSCPVEECNFLPDGTKEFWKIYRKQFN